MYVQNHIFPGAPSTIEHTARGEHLNTYQKCFCLATYEGSHCSQPVEGGGYILHTELDKSLTEDDAGADQCHAARGGGHHNSQDQRYLPLWRFALRTCGRISVD